MSTLLPAALAGAAVLVATAPRAGEVRVRGVVGGSGGAGRGALDPAGPSVAGGAHRLGLLLTAARSRSDRLLLAGAVLVGLLLGGVVLAAVGLGAGIAAGAAWRSRGRQRRDDAERAGAVEACAVLAAELRAGRPPAPALAAAAEVAQGPFAARLRSASAAAGFGGDVVPALSGVSGRGVPDSAVPEVAAALAACWQVCAGTGAGLAAAVDRIATGLRAAERTRQAVASELAGPRATAVTLALLPVAGVGLAAALGARPLHVLLETGVGNACLVLGVGLDLLGLAVTRRIASAAAGSR